MKKVVHTVSVWRYFLVRGCRGNLTLITLRSERVIKHNATFNHSMKPWYREPVVGFAATHVCGMD